MTRLHSLLAVITSVIACMSGACYAPELQDCTVICTRASDCAAGQVCGADGFCADESVAGMCGDADPVDGRVTLRVQIDGVGRLRIYGVGDCVTMDDDDDELTECSWQVPPVPLRVEAIAIDGEREFDRWTTTTCSGPWPSCTFTPIEPTMLGVKFR